MWRPVFATFGPALFPPEQPDAPAVPSAAENSRPDYAVVLTSCGRFDLLAKTAGSLLAHLDWPPAQFIVTEDSGDERVREVLSQFNAPFDIVVNRPKLGQAASIDLAYARVKTPLVFHCEDDWEFFRGGFLSESLPVLSAFPAATAVCLRGRAQNARFQNLPAERLDGVRFFRARSDSPGDLHGYSYNPGLRRIADWRRVGPFADIGGEGDVSWLFKMLGCATAHLESPAVRHLGDTRHVADAKKPKRSRVAVAARAWRRSRASLK